MTGALTAGVVTFRRELRTIVRTPGYLLLVLGLFAVVFGVLVVGGGGETGFIPAIVDLLVPTELLVPVLAVIFGYRALLTDTKSGEYAVVRTYPIGVGSYVAGVVIARMMAFLAIVTVVYGAGGVYVWMTAAPDTGIYATHAGVDSPLVFVRFLVFVLALGVTYLLLAVAVSTIANSRRGAMALGALVVIVGTAAELGIVAALAAGTVAVDSVAATLALTPNSAFRGLVFEYVVGVAFRGEMAGFVASRAALAGLAGWNAIGLACSVLTLRYGRQISDAIERVRWRSGTRPTSDDKTT